MRRLLPAAYVTWAALSIGGAVAISGLNAEAVTRLLTVAFLLGQLLLRGPMTAARPRAAPAARFVLLGTMLACVVEGFHMISTPVFASLRIARGTPLGAAGARYAADLLLTVPAYLVIFRLIWAFLRRYHYTPWQYIAAVGLGQVLGDGGIYFFAAQPAMLLFLPYPLTNYHAINVLPFLATRAQLPAERADSPRRWLVIPALIALYFVCGALIRVVGRRAGLG